MSRGTEPTHLSDEQALDYVHGLLDDVNELRTHVAACVACDHRVRDAAAAMERAKAAGELLRDAEGVLQLRNAHAQRSYATRRVAPSRRLTLWGFGVAAAVLLFAATNLRRSSDGAEYWLPVETNASLRSEPSDSDFQAALRAYGEHRAGLAVRLLEQAAVDEDLLPLRDLYLASALSKSGNAARAVLLLESLNIETLPQPWRNRALCTLVESLGASPRAQRILERLRSEPDEIGDWARRRSASN